VPGGSKEQLGPLVIRVVRSVTVYCTELLPVVETNQPIRMWRKRRLRAKKESLEIVLAVKALRSQPDRSPVLIVILIDQRSNFNADPSG